MSAPVAPARSPRRRGAIAAVRVPVVNAGWLYTALLAAVLSWIAIRGNGGLRVGNVTAVEIAVDLCAGVVAVVALLAAPNLRRRGHGAVAAVTFAILVLFAMVSTVWSIDPSQSWIEANRLISYLCVFLIGMALARLAPHRWPALLGGVTVAAVAVSAYALGHVTFPVECADQFCYARLQQPFGYWNAVGLMAALGIPGCLWFGARRAGHAALNALAYPATAVLLIVLLLSYSRGALLALIVGCAFWFAVTPLRLRGAAVLGIAGAGAMAVIAWAFSQPALSDDNVPLAQREGAGHELLAAVLVLLLALLLAGLAIGFRTARVAPSAQARRRAGAAILVGLALLPVAGAAKLATTDRGLTGSISHEWNQLTDTSADATPSNGPNRLTEIGSVRARYWNDALTIFKEHPIAGVGSGGYAIARLRVRDDHTDVEHAHGYIVQTLADRGLIGIGLSLAALVAFAIAAAQATGLGRRRRGRPRPPSSPERIGLLTMTTVIVVFGVHSLVDWTWFIPGVAIPPLLLGGWLAARGPLELPTRAPDRLLARMRIGTRATPRATAAVVAAAVALTAAWATWQPQRSINANNAALDALFRGDIAEARKLAHAAHDRDPLSIDPYITSATIERRAGDNAAALAAYQAAVRLQPGNPETWSSLAEFQLNALKRPKTAKTTVSAALYLDPHSTDDIDTLIQANRAIAVNAAKSKSKSPKR
ncbi:MAG TPA: O-antigen ligase family protein [Solirubrobacteraceae bacterium]|nr:O-antigen ligase family protein [Solirubrobacteraceae bacterium]